MPTEHAILTGKLGTAEYLTLPTYKTMRRPEDMSTVAHYLLTMDQVHPVYEQFWLTVVHLRYIPGMEKTPVKIHPDVTHEIAMFALNPNLGTASEDDLLHPERGETVPSRLMWPRSYGAQLVFDSDGQAGKMLEYAAQSMVDGFLPVYPDECPVALALWHFRLARFFQES